MTIFGVFSFFLIVKRITTSSVKASELLWNIFAFFLIWIVFHEASVEIVLHLEWQLFFQFFFSNLLLFFNVFISVLFGNVCSWKRCDVRWVKVVVLKTFFLYRLFLIVFLFLYLLSCLNTVEARRRTWQRCYLWLEVAFSWFWFA